MARIEPLNQYEVTLPARWPRSRCELVLGRASVVFDREVTNPAHPYCGRKTLHLTASSARSLARDGWQLDPAPPPEPAPTPRPEPLSRLPIPLTLEEAEAREAAQEPRRAPPSSGPSRRRAAEGSRRTNARAHSGAPDSDPATEEEA